MHINDNFAKFSEALFIADRHAREEVRQRSLMQQKLAEKEKAAKEENLRMLAQRAREERAGIPARTESKPTAERTAAMKSSLGAYGSDSESGSNSFVYKVNVRNFTCVIKTLGLSCAQGRETFLPQRFRLY